MKSNLRKEIDAILSSKLNDALQAYQTEQDQDFEKLAVLKESIESLEAERADVQKKMGSLNVRKNADLAEHNRLDGKLRWLERQMKEKRSQIDALMAKLTEVDPKTLNLLLNFQGVKSD